MSDSYVSAKAGAWKGTLQADPHSDKRVHTPGSPAAPGTHGRTIPVMESDLGDYEHSIGRDRSAWLIIGALTTNIPSVAQAHGEFIATEGNQDGVYTWSSYLVSPIVDSLNDGSYLEPTVFWAVIERLLEADDADVRHWVYCEVIEVTGPQQEKHMGRRTLALRKKGDRIATSGG
jgi:hypothetical protein